MDEEFDLLDFEEENEEYLEILQDFIKSAGLEGAVLCSSDGLPMASAMKEGIEKEIEEDMLAAMSAAALTLGFKVAHEVSSGIVEQITIKSSNGLVVMNGIGDEAVLTAVAGDKIKLGFLNLEMKKARDKLAALLL